MNKILVVIDMQNDFIDGILGTKEAQNIVNNVVNKIANFDGDIYITQDTHSEDYLKTQEGVKLPIKHCIKETHGWDINNDVFSAINEICIFRRYEKNTFGSVILAEDIQVYNDIKEITEIEIIGVCTDICVISNAILLKTFLPEVKITVDASCCAGTTPDNHQKALDVMRMCQINIVSG